MLGIEVISSVLATSTAKALTKFLDEKVGEYISKKFDNRPPNDFEVLKNEIGELKIKLEKKSTDLSQEDIQEVRNAIAKIYQKQSSSSDKIISDSTFLEWSNNELDIEDQALIAQRELDMLLDSANKLKISEIKRWDIRQVVSAIDINLKYLKTARRNYQMGVGPQDDVIKSIFAAALHVKSFLHEK